MSLHARPARIALVGVIALLAACSSGSGESTTAATGGTTATAAPPVANQAPVISGTSAKSMESDDSITTSFTVADAETPVTDLAVSVTSSDTTLFRADSLVVTGSGATRTLRLTPVEDRSGRTTLVVTATDAQGATGSASFVLDVLGIPTTVGTVTAESFVRAGNDAPIPLTGKSFTPDGEDPASFDGLINSVP